ncbi:MAG: ribosome-inactivating family protein [Planctomycetota bacterium]
MPDLYLTGGREYFQSMRELDRDISGNRAGFIEVDLHVHSSPPVRVAINRKTLYVAGFYAANARKWYHFSDQKVPEEFGATQLAIDSSYKSLGSLSFGITVQSVQSIAKLNGYDGGTVKDQHKNGLRHICVGVCEALRFADVITRMMAVLNLNRTFQVNQLEDQITNWKTGSRVSKPGILILHANP